MYYETYGLRENPFALTPDPRFLFFTASHREALAAVVYAVTERKGFAAVLGEVGTGKTTLVRHLIGELGPHVRVVYVFTAVDDFAEFLRAVLQELEIAAEGLTKGRMIAALGEFLVRENAAGRYVVLVIDEAQGLGDDVLEQLRLLTNFETSRAKLLQIILVGQPELAQKLQRHELRQVRQRIAVLARLTPLSASDTTHYVCHRLRMAGRREPLFTSRALGAIHQRARGIPRVVNVTCDGALVQAYALGARRVTSRHVRRLDTEGASIRVTEPPARRVPDGWLRLDRRPRGVAAALVVGSLAFLAAGSLFAWSGPVSLAGLGTAVSWPWPPTMATRAEAPAPSALPSRAVPVVAMAAHDSAHRERRDAATAGAAPRDRSHADRDRLLEMVREAYGSADDTLVDLVKLRNGLEGADVGEAAELRFPPLEPASMVYRVPRGVWVAHLATVRPAHAEIVRQLRATAERRGRTVFVVPVELVPGVTAHRVLVGDFGTAAEAERFYRSFPATTALHTAAPRSPR
jgi:general secretion pathway protein A